jgi:hypothetical protein
MVVGAESRCSRVRLKNRRFLDPTYCKKPRDKFAWWERTWELSSHNRRAIPTIDEGNWVLKLEIMCTSRCHWWEVYDVSRYEACSHLGSLICSRLRKREKKNWRKSFRISFSIHPNLRDKIHFKGCRFVTTQNFKFWNVNKIH